MVKSLCAACRRRPPGRNRSGRCEICNAVARDALRRDHGGRQVYPAYLPPVPVYPIPPLEVINRKLAQWLDTQERGAHV